MAKQVLDGPDVDPAFQEVGGEGMPKGVAGRGFGEPGFAHGVSELALHGDFVNVVSGDPASFRVRTKRRRWKEKLPGPFAGGVGVFSHEGFEGARQGDDSVFRAFDVVDDDCSLTEIDVFDA